MENQGLLKVRDLAKLITEEDSKITGKELFEKLRVWGLIWFNGDNKKLPTSNARIQGYLDLMKSSTGFDRYGREQIATVIVVTEKGQEYIRDRLSGKLN